jgi:hypothetical protein
LIVGDFAGVEDIMNCDDNEVIEKMLDVKTNENEMFYSINKINIDKDRCNNNKCKKNIKGGNNFINFNSEDLDLINKYINHYNNNNNNNNKIINLTDLYFKINKGNENDKLFYKIYYYYPDNKLKINDFDEENNQYLKDIKKNYINKLKNDFNTKGNSDYKYY